MEQAFNFDADAFREHGWTAASQFFNAEETDAIRCEVERLRRAGVLRNVATEGDGKTTSRSGRNLQLCPTYRHSPLFRALPFAPKVVTAVSALIGDPVVLRLDQVFLKPAGDGVGTAWHQDNAYFQIRDPLRGTAMWIAVHDATVENGTIHVIPDAFREPLPHDRDPNSDHHIRCWPDESRAVPIELPAGGVAFFAYGTPHCTLANRTSRDRAGAAFHFVNGENIAEDRQLDGKPMPGYNPVFTGPDATGGLREYGERVAGTWEAEVERARTAA
ncbi:MAG TPA: phytanoyl-CoA dioxygenase family protein [Chthonomonadaceae bacterium]|nr:phytanoyl-CoA dioxygenase family protein [Chthonomonadaceae bacterium]